MWLPPAPPPLDLSALPVWEPPGGRSTTALRYIVVDELHGGIAGLVVSPWPRLDERGRLVFGASEADSVRVAAPAEALRTVLEVREPVGVDEALRDAVVDRDVEIGDVFAARVVGQPANGDPAAWMASPGARHHGPGAGARQGPDERGPVGSDERLLPRRRGRGVLMPASDVTSARLASTGDFVAPCGRPISSTSSSTSATATRSSCCCPPIRRASGAASSSTASARPSSSR